MYPFNQHYRHHISFIELGHLLTRSGFTYPEVSSKVYHDLYPFNVTLTFILWHLILFSYPWYGVYIGQSFKFLCMAAYKRL